MENYIPNPYVKYWLKDNILYSEYSPGLVLDIKVAKACQKSWVSLIKDKKVLSLADVSQIKSSTKEARDYLASEEATQGIVAGALVTDSTVSKVIGNFFIRINKPKIPAKIFTDRKEAEEWLKQYKNH